MEQHSTPHEGPTNDRDDDRSTEEIRRDIERRRASIARTVDQAGQKLHQSMDWREQLREHPYGALALAALAGVAFAGFSTRRPRSAAADLAMLLTGAALPRPGLGAGVRAALTALATQTAMSAFRRRMDSGRSEPVTDGDPSGSAQERTW